MTDRISLCNHAEREMSYTLRGRRKGSRVKEGLKQDRVMIWKVAYEDHGPAVLAYLKSRIGRKEDAEDLLQETFLKALRSAEMLKDPEKIRSYLFTIAHNTLVNHIRKKREHLPGTSSDAAENWIESVQDDGSQAPDTSTEHRELEDKLGKAMEKMPEKYRQAFKLAVLDKRSYADIARITGWTLAQVKINVFRARKHAISSLEVMGISKSD